MKKHRTTICAGTIVATLCASHRLPVAAAAPEDFSSLALRLTATRNTYLVGEPVSVEASLSNPTAEPITAHNYFDPMYGFISILISFEGSAFRTYRGPRWGIADVIIKPKQIAPGASTSQPIVLLYNHKSTLPDEIPSMLGFPAPGKYLFKAEFHGLEARQRIESPAIRIDVADPQGADREAAELLKSDDALYFLHTGFARNTDVVRQFETLLASYPDCRYASYVREALARHRAPVR